ncbi:MAG: ABC transporter ATP-binding protein [Rhizobiales bacterium]|nr:ABC transporter ATP-binding protein [Hyphomicrobiales bacterium]
MLHFYRHIWSTTGRQQFLLVALAVVISLLSMVPLEFQRHIINGLAGRDTVTNLALLCGGYLAVSLCVSALKWILNLRSNALGEDCVRTIRDDLFDNRIAIARSGGADSQQGKAGTLLTMISSEAEKVGRFTGEAFSGPLVEAGTLVSVLGYMLFTEPALGLIVLVLAIPQVILVPMVQKKINLLTTERVKTLRAANDMVVESLREGEDGALQAKPFFATVMNLQIGVYRLKFGSRALINGANSLAIATILLAGGWMVLEGKTEIGIVVAFLSGFDKIVDPSRQLIAFFRSVSSIRVQFELITEAMAAKA